MKTNSSIYNKLMIIIVMLSVCIMSMILVKPVELVNASSSTSTSVNLHNDTLAMTPIEDNATITFLTHGLGGDAGDWSNDFSGINNSGRSFASDADSIIEKIRNTTPNGIKLYRVVNKENANSNFKIYSEYSNNEVTTITNFAQHIIVVMEIATWIDMENAYDLLHFSIDNISSMYKNELGCLPRINLIGHSMGGLLNMQYAIEHPKNVDSILSLGTPYNGSWYDNEFVSLIDSTFEDQPCLTGACGHNYYFCDLTNRQNAWNDMYNENTHINFHALSGETTFSIMNSVIWDKNYLEDYIGLGAEIGIRAAFVAIPALNVATAVLPGDVCVDKSSQQAEGYNGVLNYNKVFTTANSNALKRSRDYFPVPHNLETYDSEMHEYIINNATFESPFLVNNMENSIVGTNVSLSGSIKIPNQLNGANITSIGNNAFANQEQITEIILPTTIINIGDNAFKNCSNLTTITGLDNITYIGSFAFNGCNALLSITLPESLTSIGDGIFAGCNNLDIDVDSGNANFTVVDNILYNIDKAEILSSGKVDSSVAILDSVMDILPYAFYGNDNLEEVYFAYSPSIEEHAFENCTNLEEVHFIAYDVPELGVNAFANSAFTLYVPYSSTASFAYEFGVYDISVASYEIVVTFISDDDVYDTLNTYYGATISDLTYPTKTGYTFGGWYDNESYLGCNYINGEILDTLTDIMLYAKWTPITTYISFSGYGSDDLENMSVTYDSEIGQMPEVEKDGHTFLGWADMYGNYYTSEMIWQSTSMVNVTSMFSANLYTIVYNGNGGTSRSSQKEILYGSVIDGLAIADLTGSTFIGWNTSADGSGELVSDGDVYDFDENITLYAQYNVNYYDIMFDKQGGTGGSDGTNATYDSSMPEGLIAPTKIGYTFGGYFLSASGLSTQYYDSNMDSVHNWDNLEGKTLFAYWIANKYTIKLLDNGFDVVITSTSSSDIVYINFVASESEYITLWTSHTVGDPYLYLYDAAGNQLSYNDDGYGNYDSQITYYVNAGTVYCIGFRAYSSTSTTGMVHYSGVNVNNVSLSVPVTYGASMPNATAPIKTGYTFNGYFVECDDGEDVQYYSSEMYSTNNWNIAENITLYAYWEANKYTVTLDFQGGVSGSGSVTAIYDNSMPSATAPTKMGYTFNGYYLVENGVEIQYYSSTMTSVSDWNLTSNVTLYAYWVANTYTVTLDFQGGTGGSSSVTATYDNSMPNATAPTREGYVFKGYFSATDGLGAKYYDAGMISVNEWDIDSNTTLYAYWEKIYTVTLNNYTPNGGTAPSLGSYDFYDEYEYKVSDPTFSLPYVYDTYYEFEGWYTGINGTGTQYYQIVQGTASDLTLYAKWSMITLNTLEAHRLYNSDGTYSIPYTDNGSYYDYMIYISHDVTVITSVTLTAPSYLGYDFVNWTLTGPASSFGTLSSSDNTFFASTVTITVDFDDVLSISELYLIQFVANYVEVIPVILSVDARYSSWFVTTGWDIKITNPNDFAITVIYNAKMCFGGDATNYDNLSDLVTVTIAANSSKTVYIASNGTAGYVTAKIQYNYNDNYSITYGNSLSDNSITLHYYIGD